MATKYYVANAHVNETILLKAANDFEPVNAFHIADAEDGVRDYLQKDASGKLSRKLSYAPIEPGGIMKVPLDYAKIFLANGTVLYATDTPAYAVALIVTSHGFVYSDLLPVDDGEQVDRARFFTDHLIHNNYDPAHVAVVPVTHNGTFNTFKIFGCAPDLTNEELLTLNQIRCGELFAEHPPCSRDADAKRVADYADFDDLYDGDG